MNPNQFYALPQSPQTLKQLLMVAGYDKYFQIVRCFRDEDLRATDRQPEFTQIDCEMSFVEQEDVLEVFERWAKHMFREVLGIDFAEPFRRMPWIEAMEKYGSDKPDLRFGMEFHDVTGRVKGHGFGVFDDAGTSAASPLGMRGLHPQADRRADRVRQAAAGGRQGADLDPRRGRCRQVVGRQVLHARRGACRGRGVRRCGGRYGLPYVGTQVPNAHAVVRPASGSGPAARPARSQAVRSAVGRGFPDVRVGRRDAALYAMHHPFTSPKPEDVPYLESDPGRVRANAYDFVCNGTEIGGGSIRIHDPKLQAAIFSCLGFTPEKAQEQFGFLMNAFKYGAPPHGGLAFGFDRLCSLFGGSESIRDYIAFPKNNAGRDVMLDAPSAIDPAQLDELYLALKAPEAK